MPHLANQDPLFEVVKSLIIESRNPSVSYVQRTLKLGYGRANAMIEALEGEIVTPKDANGWRNMLNGITVGREQDGFEVV